jgi:oxygen-independent coproporphyrinogen-3 oxidase
MIIDAQDVCRLTTNNRWRNDFPAIEREYVWIYPVVRDNIFDTQSLFSSARKEISDEISVYIHVPVCLYHCPMCEFYTETIHDRLEIEGYEDYVIRELSFYKDSPATKNNHLKSICFGGGTPSLLKPEAVKKIIDSFFKVFELHKDVQVTLESHPNDVNYDYLSAVHQYGVNRISFGIQSFNDNDLQILELRQKSGSNKAILRDAYEAGFETIAVDLIYRIPGQKDETFLSNIHETIDLGATSISLYSLDIQETQKNLFSQQQSMEEGRKLFFESRDFLLKKGFEHFAQPDFYMHGHMNQDMKVSLLAPQGQAIGIGAGAWSYFNNAIYCSIHNLDKYKEELDRDVFPVLAGQRISIDDEMSRYMVLGVRVLRVPTEPFFQYFGVALEDVFYRELRFLEERELIKCSAKEIALTDRGLYYIDNVSKEFFSFANRCRLQPFSWGIADEIIGE